jgi:hypothetical protein
MLIVELLNCYILIDTKTIVELLNCLIVNC